MPTIHTYAILILSDIVSLGSRPSPYVRVLIARGWENRSMIRHVRLRSVVQYSASAVGHTSRAPRGAGVARYFLDIRLF